MADVRIKYTAAPDQFRKSAERIRRTIAVAATGAINDAGVRIKIEGRENIAAAGFSKRWQNTFRVNLYPDKGRAVSLHPALLAYHKIPYAGIFESGGVIAGSPLLWLPLPNVPTTLRGRHMTPANYIRLIGPLHTIYRAGKAPLLAGYLPAGSRGGGGSKITVKGLEAGARAARSSRRGAAGPRLISVPLFFGVNKVTLQKQFNLKPIFDRAAASLESLYAANLRRAI
jgi:hypothetical protein